MTPNNILNMASLKELDIIAITDHNSCLQLDTINELSKSYNMLVICGVEVTTSENYHVVCLFKTIEKAKAFQEILETKMLKQIYDKNFLGEEQLLDVNDDVIDNLDYSLHTKTSFTVFSLKETIKELEGIMILAHIEKYHQDIYDKLQTEYSNIFNAVEVMNINTCIKSDVKKIHNSDAHQITDILERTSYVELEHLSIDEFFKYMEE